MTSKIFYELIETVANEHGLSKEDVRSAIVEGLVKGVKAEGYTGKIDILFDEEATKIRIYRNFHVFGPYNKKITEECEALGISKKELTEEQKAEIIARAVEVEKATYGDACISLEDAKEIKAKVKEGSNFKVELAFNVIGRKGATRFKQVFNQELKKLEYVRAQEFFGQKEGEVISATVVKSSDKAVILDLGLNTTAYMPIEDSIGGEKYINGTRIQVQITKVEETSKGPKVYVSRSQKEIIKRLFELYIPEVSQGVIDIMSIAREPGNRTKIGIKSNNPNVDAKGACVGIGGARIKQINAALNGERIDIFEWSDNPIILIAESLTPAKVISVLADTDTHKAIVIVPDDQFSLAIGKGGQNVRLASQTIGWKIDIKDETTAYRDEIHFKPNVYTA